MKLIKGDITKLDVDIIVNAANKTLLGGGGVDGAIHRGAGPKLLMECKTLHGCNTGNSKMTDAYNLPCKKIIHTVGPIYYYEKEKSPLLLKECYISSMKLANEYRLNNNLDRISIAFPCISTGVYGYPKREACKIAVDTIKKINNSNIDVLFVCFDDENYNIYMEVINNEKTKDTWNI